MDPRTLPTLLLLALLIAPAAVAATPDENAATLDTIWLFIGACLVFLMQAGFALLGAGAVRTKNTANYLMKSVMDFSLGALVFFLVGYAFMFGNGGVAQKFIGLTGFGVGSDPGTLIFFLFQVMFAATAATIVAGAVAERMKMGAYVIYTIAITAIIYPIFGHWVWGGGFLADLGMTDFAGSGVVHAVGGLLAFVAAFILGPRLGRFNKDGTANAMPGHNQPYVVLGTLLLFFGWFGFNTGSTLAAGDAGVPLIAVNTFLAGCAGATAVFLVGLRKGTVELGTVCNGMLSGLVAITAPVAFVSPVLALVIGALGGFVYLGGAFLLVNRLKVDDPVGAIPVHGITGVFGVLAVGIFADGTGGVTGLLFGGVDQFVSQLIGVAVLLAWTLGTGFVLFKGIDVTMGLRIDAAAEARGLDEAHHGGSVYPELASNVSHAPIIRRAPTAVTRRTGTTTSGSFKK